MVETFAVEEICHKFLCLLIPEYNQPNAPWPLMMRSKSLFISGNLPTYPSLKPTLTLTSHLGQNDGLEKG